MAKRFGSQASRACLAGMVKGWGVDVCRHLGFLSPMTHAVTGPECTPTRICEVMQDHLCLAPITKPLQSAYGRKQRHVNPDAICPQFLPCMCFYVSRSAACLDRAGCRVGLVDQGGGGGLHSSDGEARHAGRMAFPLGVQAVQSGSRPS